MKKLLKAVIVPILGFFARAVIRRYRPRVVMITGSVGKTSTKDAIATILATRFYVRKSDKSFNSEFGVPFTILGVKNVKNPKNPFAWLPVFKSAIALLVLPNHYPNMLVLEVGADKPGDIARILRIAMPDAVAVTRLPETPVHVEAYPAPDAVREEEFSPAYALPAGAPLIISADDPYSLDNAKRISARIISYGTAENADLRISDICFSESGGKVGGMQANISANGETWRFFVKGSAGEAQMLPLAAALAVARAFDIPPQDALIALNSYKAPPGRSRLLAGRNGSVIIDDSYNSSPAAVEEALKTLKAFPHATRRVAVLGDMLELGRYSVREHQRIAELAGESADLIVTVGIRARAFAVSSKNSEIMRFDNSSAAALALPPIVREGDVILVKGSQSIRTERIVEALLADPADAANLVRQEKEWKRRT